MKNLPWKKIAIGCLIVAALVVVRSAVSAGRAMYWHQSAISVIQKDPWTYIGFAALAIAIVAWTFLPAKDTPPDAQTEEIQEEV